MAAKTNDKSGGDRFNTIQQKLSPCSGNRESPLLGMQSGPQEDL